MNDKYTIFRAATGQLRIEGERIIVPVVALVGDLVLHAVNSDQPEFVPLSTLSSHVGEWAGKPVCLGHPTDANGRQLSASTPGIIEKQAFGTIENARVADRKLLMDCRIDPARAEKVGASRLLERMAAGEVVDVSVGCFVVTENTPGQHFGKPYARRWLGLRPDHLSFVERGACSISDGCGAGRAAEKRDEDLPPAPDAYAEAIAKRGGLKPVCPFDDKEYDPHGRPPDGYGIAIERQKNQEVSR
jgi:hypothetical protein